MLLTIIFLHFTFLYQIVLCIVGSSCTQSTVRSRCGSTGYQCVNSTCACSTTYYETSSKTCKRDGVKSLYSSNKYDASEKMKIYFKTASGRAADSYVTEISGSDLKQPLDRTVTVEYITIPPNTLLAAQTYTISIVAVYDGLNGQKYTGSFTTDTAEYDEICSSDDSCQENKYYTCYNKKCKCSSNYFWYLSSCKKVSAAKPKSFKITKYSTTSLSFSWSAQYSKYISNYLLTSDDFTKNITNSAQSYEVVRLKQGTTYNNIKLVAKVRTDRGNKIEDVASSINSASTKPGSVSGLSSSNKYNASKVMNIYFVKPNGGVDSYITEISGSGLNQPLKKTVKPRYITVQPNTLLPAQTYSITIVAVYDELKSQEYTGSFTTDNTVPGPVNVLTPVVTSNSFLVRWTKPKIYPGPTVYSITVYEQHDLTDNAAQTFLMKETVYGYDTQSYLVPNVESYWNYRVQIQPMTDAGNGSVFSSPIFRTSSSAPGKVTNLTVSEVDSDLVAVSWNCPSERDRHGIVTSYKVTSTSTNEERSVDPRADCIFKVQMNVVVDFTTNFTVIAYIGNLEGELTYIEYLAKKSDSAWLPIIISLSVLLFLAIIILVIILLFYKRKKANGSKGITLSKKKEKSKTTGHVNSAYKSDVEDDDRDYENMPKKRNSQLKDAVPVCLNKYENIEIVTVNGEQKKHNHAVKLEMFTQHLRGLHKNSNRLLKEELKAIQEASPNLPMTVALKLENKKKNLSMKKLPYDVNRVKLIRQDEPNKEMNDYVNIPQNDYINASYITGSSGDKKEYIVTIDPLRSTMEDFWSMIWQEEVHSIIMLSDIDKAFRKYWLNLNEIKKVNGLTIKLVKIITKKNYTSNIFELTKGTKIRSLRQYHLTGWKDGNPTKSPNDVLEFLDDVYSNIPETLAGGKIVVHSRTGNGRCGTIIGVDICRRIISDMELSDEIDIYGIVLKMLNDRTQIINLESQYGFIYDAAKEMIKGRKDKLVAQYSTFVDKNENSHVYSGIMS